MLMQPASGLPSKLIFVNDLDLHKEVCQTTKLNESEQLFAKQQTESGQNEISEQAQTNGGYGGHITI